MPVAKTIHHYHFNGAPAAVELNHTQLAMFAIVVAQAPIYRGGICPRRRLNVASARVLADRDLLIERSFPVDGFALSARGEAFAATLHVEVG